MAGFLTATVGVPEEMAAYAARASQGHIGRARALALDDDARRRRNEVVRLPGRLVDIGACMNAAANLMDIAKEETEAQTEASNSSELAELQSVFGSDPKSKASRAYRAAVRELEESQKQRAKRRVMDVIDRCLMDLLSVYRDAIALAQDPEMPAWSTRSSAASFGSSPVVRPPRRTSAGSTRSSRPATRCWSSTRRRCCRWSR